MHAGHGRTPQCQELLAQLCDYIDGELEGPLCAELEQHLVNCHDCRVLVDTTRKTITLYRRYSPPRDLPADAMDRLWQALEESGCRPSSEEE